MPVHDPPGPGSGYRFTIHDQLDNIWLNASLDISQHSPTKST